MNKKLSLKVIYFSSGAIINLFVTGLVLYYIQLGFSPAQIGILTSATYLAALFQPFIGMMSDKSKSPKTLFQVVLIIFLIFVILLSKATNYYVYVVLVFVASIGRNIMFGLLDNLTLRNIDKYGGNFGEIRKFASIGYGIALMLAYPFITANDISNFFYVLIALIIISIIAIFPLYDAINETDTNHHYRKDIKQLFTNKVYILIVLANVCVMGIGNIKGAYQPILFDSLNASSLIISLSTVFMVIPEIFIMPVNKKIASKHGNLKVLLLAAFAIIIQLIGFVLVDSVVMLLALMVLHGIAMGLYIPLFSAIVIDIVDKNVSSTALLFNSTMQFVLIFFINLFIVTPLYSLLGIRSVFIALLFFSFIGVWLFKKALK